MQPYRDTGGPGRDGFRAMLDAAGAQPGPKGLRDVALLRLLHDLGLRRSEAVRLDIEDVDLPGNRIFILGRGRSPKQPVSLARADPGRPCRLARGPRLRTRSAVRQFRPGRQRPSSDRRRGLPHRRLARRQGRCFPSVRTLAAATEQPRSTVSRHLAQNWPLRALLRVSGALVASMPTSSRPASCRPARGVPPARSGCPTTENRRTGRQENRVRASAIRQIRGELRRDPRRAREMGGAAAVVAAIPVLAAAVGSEADRAGVLCTAGGARSERLIAFGSSLRGS